MTEVHVRHFCAFGVAPRFLLQISRSAAFEQTLRHATPVLPGSVSASGVLSGRHNTVRWPPRSKVWRDTNDTKSTAKRHRHDTDGTYCACATAGAAGLKLNEQEK